MSRKLGGWEWAKEKKERFPDPRSCSIGRSLVSGSVFLYAVYR